MTIQEIDRQVEAAVRARPGCFAVFGVILMVLASAACLLVFTGGL